jgi:hypothetical protein
MAAMAARRATSSQLVVIAVSKNVGGELEGEAGDEPAAQAQPYLALVMGVARREHRPQALEEGFDGSDDDEDQRQPVDRIDSDAGRENQPLPHRVALMGKRAGRFVLFSSIEAGGGSEPAARHSLCPLSACRRLSRALPSKRRRA